MDTTARLLITCADCPGIVATVTGFLYNHNANITALDQYSTDPEGGRFFMRLEFQTPHLDISRAGLERAFAEVVARRFALQWRISYAADPKRTAILAGKQDHALMELLWRWRRGELPTEIAMLISNHPDHAQAAREAGVPHHHVPVDAADKGPAEAQILGLLEGAPAPVDLVVLARYMQVLTPAIVSRFAHRIINIHHSFLPAFVGAKPYLQAHQRGVKVIGATAHYVTETLDEGPIIEQDVMRVSHRHSVKDLVAAGVDLERQVLARAVRWHLEDRIIVHGTKTVVFA